MILEIVKYGHPVLREKGRRVDPITREVRQLAADMVETMYAANGVGLAAQQVGRALQLAVVDVGDSELPSELIVNGQPQDLQSLMPLVLINPELSRPEGETFGEEGCLSFPEINADVRRAARITVRAQRIDGRETIFACTGLLARAIQHEIDHLNGVLFVDRMGAATKASLSGRLRKLQTETRTGLGKPRRFARAVAGT